MSDSKKFKITNCEVSPSRLSLSDLNINVCMYVCVYVFDLETVECRTHTHIFKYV